ncbi:MAG: oligopeptide/dipeptide ABC transporter ATP-binding protein [Akkermansiaceae bacterium]|jgi:oligopeptide/dipeptide ABC transporter ATP-binding protein
MSELLDINGLVTSFDTDGGWVRAVDGVSFSVESGKTVGLVGESGCGKTVTAMSIIDLLPKPSGHVLEGEILFKGEDLRKVEPKRMREVRGGEIGVIFQEPMAALNPVHRIGKQIVEILKLHENMSSRAALQKAVQLLDAVGIPAPEKRISAYPHELSGGMRQRVMIAIAIACEPDLLIADEPTTALDVTVQAQILELIESMQEKLGMAVLMITHDLGVIAQNCDEVVVMYAGRVVERAPVNDLFANPRHAYTKGLLNSIPRIESVRKSELNTIPGQVAAIQDFVAGCRFCQRMDRRNSVLLRQRPEYREISPGHWVETCPECFQA